MAEQRSPQDLVEDALELSTADGCVAIVQVASSANLRWANNTLTTNGVMRRCTVTVVAVRDHGEGPDGRPLLSAGAVSGVATDRDAVCGLVEQADAAAASAPPAPDAAPLVTGVAATDWHEQPAETSIAVYRELAPALGEAFARAESAGRILAGFVDHDLTTTYLGSSTGLRLRHEQPTGHWGCTGKSGGSSAWVGGATRDFRDVDAAAMDAALEMRLGWARRRIDLPAGRYDTVLPPTAVADLMIYAYWVADARTAHDGQSVWSRPGGGTRIGDTISTRPFDLLSNPHDSALQACPFVVSGASTPSTSVFDNGLSLQPTAWVRAGVVESLVQTRETATLTGQPVTPAIDNLTLRDLTATASLEDLVESVQDGLLLTCLWYIREVDPQSLLLTGLTRDGVYRVEGGEITGAVNNFRFNERPLDLLARASDVSRTVPTFSREWGDYFPRTAMPALRVPDFHMSTVSEAQ